jgi:uncharacterized protein YndB with AHSA1/START domain
MAKDIDRNDGSLDLTLKRTIDAPRALIWKVWTDPKHVMKWWAPAPWTTVDCEIDLRPGGMIRTVMRSPEGQDYPNVGCFLELIENEKLIWTDALGPGYRPALEPFFTAIFTLEEHAGKTNYAVRVLHKDEADKKKHEDMGFQFGWSKCLDQLVELVTRLKN